MKSAKSPKKSAKSPTTNMPKLARRRSAAASNPISAEAKAAAEAAVAEVQPELAAISGAIKAGKKTAAKKTAAKKTAVAKPASARDGLTIHALSDPPKQGSKGRAHWDKAVGKTVGDYLGGFDKEARRTAAQWLSNWIGGKGAKVELV